MMRALKFFRLSVRALFSSVLACTVWSLWIVLGLLLVLQIYVFSTQELAVPGFLLRHLEQRLEASGLRVTFSRTSFDPSGRFLVENVSARLPAFEEPVLGARAVYARLNPWLLAVGRIELRELRVMDATASVPAMLSGSGRPEEIIRNLNLVVIPRDRQYRVDQLSAQVAGVVVSAYGVVPAPAQTGKEAQPDFVGWLAREYPGLCRQAMAVTEQLAGFEQPSLQVEAGLTDAGAVRVGVELLARTAKLEIPVSAQARDVRLLVRALVLGEASIVPIEFSAAELKLPFDTVARDLHASVTGRLPADGTFRFEPREFEVSLGSLASNGWGATNVSAQLHPHPLPQLDAAVVAQIAGAPLGVDAEADLAAQSARLHFRGAVSPDLLTPLSTQLGVEVRRFFDFASLQCQDGSVTLGPGWKFERLSARVAVKGINAYGVRMDEGETLVELDPRRFHSPEVYGRIGENFARGSYDHDLRTHEFRFLLDGRLRPLDISGWFRPWWSEFFRQFEFPAESPPASVDVQGQWREGRRSDVFVQLATRDASVRGAPFDELRTRLRIRPGRYEGFEVSGTNGGGRIQGRFELTNDPDTHVWHTFDLNLQSSMALAPIAKVMGQFGEKLFAPYQVSNPPLVRLNGHFAGPEARGGASQVVDATVKTTGEMRVHDFPLNDTSFALRIRNDEITVNDVHASFAAGAVDGQVRVTGPDSARRVGFNLTVTDASLGEGITTLQSFFARQRHEPPPTPGKFVQEKANVRMDVSASAEGAYGAPYSFRGNGNAMLRGAEIGAVPLLGSLSELLKFTALRFTEARANFLIEGPNLQFPEVTLRGSNSAVDAHGSYSLEAKQLDFRAKVFPFQESGNLLKVVFGAVLAPLSNVLEVKLSGSLEKPEWGFLLLSSRTPTDTEKKGEEGPKSGADGTSTTPNEAFPQGASRSQKIP
jgi:hypothetical protein